MKFPTAGRIGPGRGDPAPRRRPHRPLVLVVVVAAVTGVAALNWSLNWWPATFQQTRSATGAAGSWPFPTPEVGVTCQRHWGGRRSVFVVVDGVRFALDGATTAQG